MTELLLPAPHNAERRDCAMTGKHLNLALLAAGVGYDTEQVREVAREACVFEQTLVDTLWDLHRSGHVELNSSFQDILTQKGTDYADAPIEEMVQAHAIVQGVIGV